LTSADWSSYGEKLAGRSGNGQGKILGSGRLLNDMPVFDEDIDRGVGSFVPNPDGQDGIAIAIDSVGREDRCGTCLIESAENRFAPVAADGLEAGAQ